LIPAVMFDVTSCDHWGQKQSLKTYLAIQI